MGEAGLELVNRFGGDTRGQDFMQAHETVMVAAQLEYDAKNGDAESAKASLSTLVVVVERLLRDLANLCQESQQ